MPATESSNKQYNLYWDQAQLEANPSYCARDDFVQTHTWSGASIATSAAVAAVHGAKVEPAELCLVGQVGTGPYDVKVSGLGNHGGPFAKDMSSAKTAIVITRPHGSIFARAFDRALSNLRAMENQKCLNAGAGQYMLICDDDEPVGLKCSSKIMALNTNEALDPVIQDHTVPPQFYDEFALLREDYHLTPIDIRDSSDSPVLPPNSARSEIALRGSLVLLKFRVTYTRMFRPEPKDIFTAHVRAIKILCPRKALERVYGEYKMMTEAVKEQMRAARTFVPGKSVLAEHTPDVQPRTPNFALDALPVPAALPAPDVLPAPAPDATIPVVVATGLLSDGAKETTKIQVENASPPGDITVKVEDSPQASSSAGSESTIEDEAEAEDNGIGAASMFDDEADEVLSDLSASGDEGEEEVISKGKNKRPAGNSKGKSPKKTKK